MRGACACAQLLSAAQQRGSAEAHAHCQAATRLSAQALVQDLAHARPEVRRVQQDVALQLDVEEAHGAQQRTAALACVHARGREKLCRSRARLPARFLAGARSGGGLTTGRPPGAGSPAARRCAAAARARR
jgi:hypothetical protein